jgi:hypothetical protein
MNATSRRSPGDRDRAVARLRAITIGTSIAIVAAVGAFGVVAAQSYSGGSSDVTTAAATSTTGTSTTTSTSTGTSEGIQATAAPTATAATTTTTTGSSHASTGGS